MEQGALRQSLLFGLSIFFYLSLVNLMYFCITPNSFIILISQMILLTCC